MEWDIRPLARRCAVTNEAFEPGQRVICILYVALEDGQLARADIGEGEADAYEVPGNLLARWTREVKEPGREGEARKQALESSEELFLALCRNEVPGDEPESEQSAQVDALKHLLALLLERKRILRPEGARLRSGRQTYLHVPSKETFEVPVVTVDSAMLARIHSRLDDLVF